MISLLCSLVIIASLLASDIAAAFVPAIPTCTSTTSFSRTSSTTSNIENDSLRSLPPRIHRRHQPLSSKATTTSLYVIPPSIATNIILATIDSDISKLSDNEFAPVFFGGIAVMLGGLLSTIFVGTVIDKKDMYAQLIADSYAQIDNDDEEFWKGLSEEEKKKTQEFLKNIQNSKNGEFADDAAAAAAEQAATSIASAASDQVFKEQSISKSNYKNDEAKKMATTSSTAAEVGMFSDYADE